MARSRNIKPGFFTNADLATCDPLARVLFAGLWTIADKAGRLRDRPKQIKGEILPYDNCDVDALLNELATAEEPFIHRYSSEGVAYIQIVNWDKHQSPHHSERNSVIPPFVNGDDTVRARRAPICESGINEEGIRDQESGPPKTKNPGSPKKFTPPTLEEVKAYLGERNSVIDAEEFHAFYQANGWVQGKNKPVKEWESCVVTWERRAAREGKSRIDPSSDPRGNLSAAKEYLKNGTH